LWFAQHQGIWVYVKSTLILNYLGQGAWIIKQPNLDKTDVNPFFEIMPGWFSFWSRMATLELLLPAKL
jgi:KUP system potassium uptake protein